MPNWHLRNGWQHRQISQIGDAFIDELSNKPPQLDQNRPKIGLNGVERRGVKYKINHLYLQLQQVKSKIL